LKNQNSDPTKLSFRLRTSLPLEKLPKRPTIRPERDWAKLHDIEIVGGVDEAGRGPLAGPVVAAVVVFDFTKTRPVGINDSKQLTEAEREKLARKITKKALSYGISYAEPDEIDRYNILKATKIACCRAIRICNGRLLKLGREPIQGLVTDALYLEDLPIPQHNMVKGDRRSVSISAASILAKVVRDQIMKRMDVEFPMYGFAGHKGYPTKFHYQQIDRFGASTIHRFTFRGVVSKESTNTLVHSRTYQEFLGKVSGRTVHFDMPGIVDNKELRPLLFRLPKREQIEFFSKGFNESGEIVKKNTNFSLELEPPSE